MGRKTWWRMVGLAGGVILAASLNADDAELKALREQIESLSQKVQALEQKRAAELSEQEALDQKVKVLERKRELEQEASAEKAKTTPLVSLGATGLQVRSADSNFTFGIRGYLQADGRLDVAGVPTYSDTFLMRRVRPIFEGSLYKFIDYRIMLEFGSGVTTSTSNNGYLQDGYANLRFLPELQLQVGKMKEPVGLERLQSGANLLFVERGFPTALVPNRNVGVQLQGEFLEQRLSYQVGLFNGVADGGSTDFQASEAGNLAARLFTNPFRNSGLEPLEGFGVGVAATYGDYDGALRTFNTTGQQPMFAYYSGSGTNLNVLANGRQWRITPQGYYYWGPFGLFGEYVISSQDVVQTAGPFRGVTGTLQNSAWQVSGSWFITGERNSWKAVAPQRPVTLGHGGGWGALELAVRVQGVNFDEDAFPVFADPRRSARSAFAWGVGANWHLNRNLKFSVDYENTDFQGGEQNPILAQNEQVILGRLQLSF